MPRQTTNSRGDKLERRLTQAIQGLAMAPLDGARNLPIVRNVRQGGSILGNAENKLLEVTSILIESRAVFSYENSVVMEYSDGDGKRLVHLTMGGELWNSARSRLANLFICESRTPGDIAVQFPPPDKLVEHVLNRQPTLDALPRIRTYARRPVFDSQFRLCQNGWNEREGILVHGVEVDVEGPHQPLSGSRVIDRFPPFLRALLGEFCFRNDEDAANALGVLLTYLLMNHFVQECHPIVLIDGNQVGVGKTMLAQVFGAVMDGYIPQHISYTDNEEELVKRIVATLMDGQQSTLIFDNAKVARGATTISSPAIESNSMAPILSLRKLGTNTNYRKPNDILWTLTMNDTSVSPDIVSRGVPIRLAYDGDAKQRTFRQQKPLGFALEHRSEILGELISMVLRWTDQGRPVAPEIKHRLPHWAQTMGGIMLTNGFPEFLKNLDESSYEFNSELEELTALAQEAISSKKFHYIKSSTTSIVSVAQPPARWIAVFEKAGVQNSEMVGKADHPKATLIGKYLSRYVNRSVSVDVNGNRGKATLRREEARAGKKLYAFEIECEAEEDAVNDPDARKEEAEAQQPSPSPPKPKKPKSRRNPDTAVTTAQSVACRSTTSVRGAGNNEAW
jgi:hypothetical protein